MRVTELRNARTHNLAGVDLDLRPGELVTLCGRSGSGKSSLAFDTLHAEGQRRYVESFSAYARQFLERRARPPVDSLEPVPVGIAVDRQPPSRNSRSTVGTMTELNDYLKLLFARWASVTCPGCGESVEDDAPTRAAAQLVATRTGARVVVTYPVAVPDAERFVGVRDALVREGYRRIHDGQRLRDLDAMRPSDARELGGRLAVVADRLVARPEDRSRLREALEVAMNRGGGRADVHFDDGSRERFARGLVCPRCDRAFRDPTPGLFSFNSPIGACETCRGFGRTIGVDWGKVLPDPGKSVADGAIKPWGGKSTQWERRHLTKMAAKVGFPLDAPLEELSEAQRTWLVDGDGSTSDKGWFGLRGWFAWLETRAYKMHVRVLLARYRSYDTCAACRGTRLKPEADAYRVDGLTMPAWLALPLDEALAHLEAASSRRPVDAATTLLVDECRRRFETLIGVGLAYLSLDRGSRTLSGGEAQRVALSAALGSSIRGAMFVLEEPTAGLHPRDVATLLAVVRRLAVPENQVLVVEHHPDVILGADRVVELGPGAGSAGGRLVFDGSPDRLLVADTATGAALRRIPRREGTPRVARRHLTIGGASGHNLRDVSLRIPRGCITVITGPSGSGKSSLVFETLLPAVARRLGQADVETPTLPFRALEGLEGLRSAVGVGQEPLGRTSRGNPATYLGVWEHVRKRFAAEELAKERGYGPGTYSFNVPGGRCETCKGDGAETVEMQFLADVTFSCPDCAGRRFTAPVLDVKVRGLDVATLLEMSADEVWAWAEEERAIRRALEPMLEVGLGYVRLGQALNTLSGGEAQRLRLAEALADAVPGSLVVLDEPTAGLHPDDVEPLLAVLERLADRGDTVVVVEHNMRVAAAADWVVDLGPGAGADGGRIVAQGSPDEVARGASATAPFLARAIRGEVVVTRRERARGPAASEAIRVRGAREHNLRSVSVDLPRERLVAVTGPSGSGKSTLAFDVVFAEGQRRYLETLTPYARQYMTQLPRPNVDEVSGIPPCVSLEQRLTSGGANSTVATVTEVAHYVRLLYAKAGELSCPDCGIPVAARSPTEILDDARARFAKATELAVMAPVVRSQKGSHQKLLDGFRKRGFGELYVDGAFVTHTKGLKLARFDVHDVDVVIARTNVRAPSFADDVHRALAEGEGTARFLHDGSEWLVSTRRACASCGRGFPELDPRFFSFNTAQGRCEPCEGKGYVETRVGRGASARDVRTPCGACEGTRLSALARNVRVGGIDLPTLFAQRVEEARKTLEALSLGERQRRIGAVPIGEAARRLAFLAGLGLGYLSLDRAASSLSGGELQRVRLSAQLGAGLTGVLYVLDEPTIGLHPRDTHRLIGALRGLVQRGNSVVVVEHDTDVIGSADHVLDIGPGGGRNGGTVAYQGPAAPLVRKLQAAAIPPASGAASPKADAHVRIEGARLHNLKGDELAIPCGRLVSVVGVSGSGKSSLVRGELLPLVRRALGLVTDGAPTGRLLSVGDVTRAVEVDQTPIGRTPRSTPATYVGIWDEVRKLYAGLPEARARGYGPSRFSFNVKGGRCDACDGQGSLPVEMAFLPEVHVPCEACGGSRFSRETREVELRGYDIGRVLDLEIDSAVEIFESIPKVREPLALLRDLGLGYLHLGQPSNTLSGGEAQRMKLVAELATGLRTGKTLYVLDEPTTGLHRADVGRLHRLLLRLVERGDTVVLIEHQLDLVRASDYVVELGPDGGGEGGRVVFTGTPSELARADTATGRCVRAPSA